MSRASRGTPLPTLWELAALETDDCTLWPYGTSGGYGEINIGRRPYRTHALVCGRYHGARPGPWFLALHSCGNRRCVNPRHLRWGSPADNQADSDRHGTRVKGERHPQHKLTVDEVRAIRIDSRPHREIAREYGLSEKYPSQIQRRLRWSWLVD